MSKFTFDLGELVRQTDTVHTKCKLLINQIDAVQPKEENKRLYYTARTEFIAYDLLSARKSNTWALT